MRTLSFAAALVLMSVSPARAQTPSAPPDEPGPADEHAALPEGGGRELVIRVCSECHSPDLAADQQLDPAGWKSVVDPMAGQGAVATEAEFEDIVQYLANAFPALNRWNFLGQFPTR